jgi:hypothetical protein
MAAVENLNALAKTIFGDEGVPSLVPDFALIQQDVGFQTGKKMGDYYEESVRLSIPKGVTHAAGDGTAGAFDLNDPVAGTQTKAKVYGFQKLLREQMSNEDAFKLASSEQAFREGVPFFFEGMQIAGRRYVELMSLYGQSGIAVTTGSGTDAGSTSHIIAINPSYWADGIWAGALDEKLHVYDVGDDLVSSAANAIFVVSAVDFVNKTVTVTGTSTGITALESALSGGACKIFLYDSVSGSLDSSPTYKEAAGIYKLLSDTTSTIFNISRTTYGLWRPTIFDPAAAGQLTFNKIKFALSMALGQGGLMEGATLYVNNKNYDNVATEVMAQQRLNSTSVGKVEIGVDEIVFKHAAGKCVLKGHPMVWEGFGLGLAQPKKYWKRIGAADITTKVPGFGDDMFFPLGTKAGVEARIYTHQAIFSHAPAKSFLIKDLVPNETA